MATSRLISNVHRLSRATMAAMAAVSNDGQGELDEEEEEEEDLGDDEETKGWADLAAATSRNWIGRQIASACPNEDSFLEALARERSGLAHLATTGIEKVLEDAPTLSLSVVGRSGSALESFPPERIRSRLLFNGKEVGSLEAVHFDRDTAEEDSIEVWVYKRRSPDKEDKLLGVASTKVKNLLEGREDPIDLAVKMGSTEVGSILVKVGVGGGKGGARSASAMVSDLVEAELKSVLESKFPKRLPKADPGVDLEYFVHIERQVQNGLGGNNSSNSNSGYVLCGRKKHDSDSVAIPLSALSDSALSLVVAAEAPQDKDGGDGGGNSKVAKKREKRRSLDVLAELLALNMTAEAEREEEERVEVPPQKLRWFQALKIEQRGVLWRITVRASSADGKCVTDMRSHFRRLYGAHLRLSSREGAAQWDGDLTSGLGLLERCLRPLHQNSSNQTVEKHRALVDLHRRYRFNNMLMHRALVHLTNNEEDPSSVEEGVADYVAYAIRELLGLHFRGEGGRRRPLLLKQVPVLLRNLELLAGDQETAESGTTAVNNMENVLRQHFAVLDDEALVSYFRDHAVPLFEFILGSRNLCGDSAWPELLSRAMISEGSRSLKARATSAGAEVRELYFVFLNMRKVCRLTGLPRPAGEEEACRGFEPALWPLANLILSEAATQVDRVVAIERRNHGRGEEYWKSKEWQEASRIVSGIFTSCIVTFRELAWPNKAVFIDFGIFIFKGIHQVFKNFVRDFLSIATADNDFDRQELVILVVSINQTTDYLREASGAIHKVVEDAKVKKGGEGDNHSPSLRPRVQAFSEVFAEATLEADDSVEEVLETFCQSQRSEKIRMLVKQGSISLNNDIVGGEEENDEDEDDSEDTHLLQYLDHTLKILYRNLEEKHFLLVLQKLMVAAEEEMKQAFKEAQKLYAKKKSPEVFNSLVEGIPQFIQFRKNLSLPSSDLLTKMQLELYPRATPSHALVQAHLLSVIEATRKVAPEHEPQGLLELKAGFVGDHDRLLVELVSVSGVLPRSSSDKEAASFSVTAAVLPLRKEPHIQRRRTQCYYRTESVDFSADSGAAKAFAFDLPSNSYDPQDCVLEVDLYHQVAYNMKKLFGGAAFLRLGEVPVVSEEDSLKGAKSIKLTFNKINHVDSVEHRELGGRKDRLAKIFLDRYDRQRLGKSFFEAQDWAKIDEKQETFRLITAHLEEMQEDHKARASKGGDLKVAELEARITFNEVSEELTVELLRILGPQVPPRHGREDVNLSVEVKILPSSKALEARETKVRVSPPPKAHLDLSQDKSAKMSFPLRSIHYNYHRTFVQMSLFDHERPSALAASSLRVLSPGGGGGVGGAKAERFFRGHSLVALSDIHPLVTTERRKAECSAAARRLSMTTLSVRDSAALVRLLERKDKRAKEYVVQLNRMRDGVGEKVPYSPRDWVDATALVPTRSLICRDLEWNRMMQYQGGGLDKEYGCGTLRYRATLEEGRRRLRVELRNVSGLNKSGGGSGETVFSITVRVLPGESSPFWESRQTGSFRASGGGFLFDLPLDGSGESGDHQMSFDLPEDDFDLGHSYVSFELHKQDEEWRMTTSLSFSGSFFLMMDAVPRDEEVPFDMEGRFSEMPEESAEFGELEERASSSSSDPMAKAYVARYSRYRRKNGKGASRFFLNLLDY